MRTDRGYNYCRSVKGEGNVNDRFHPESSQILERLRQEKILSLYHFTCIENIQGIQQMNALCSKQTLQSAGLWPPPEPGGNTLSHDLDRRNGNWDKISLNFTPYTPMVYNKKSQCHLCFFILKPEVAGIRGAIFTDTNATSSGQQRMESLQGLNLINFPVVRSSPRPWDKEGWHRPVQAEVLVSDRIGLEYVEKVAFISTASMEEAERLWGNQPHPIFAVEPHYFSDTPHSVSLSFPFLDRILLTDDSIDKATVNKSRTHKKRFNRENCDIITAVAFIQATTGVKAEVIWQPMGFSYISEFEKTERYWHWVGIPINKFPDGICSLEYRLGGIRWTTIKFGVLS